MIAREGGHEKENRCNKGESYYLRSELASDRSRKRRNDQLQTKNQHGGGQSRRN